MPSKNGNLKNVGENWEFFVSKMLQTVGIPFFCTQTDFFFFFFFDNKFHITFWEFPMKTKSKSL